MQDRVASELYQKRVEIILELAKHISIADLIKTEEALKELKEAKSAENVNEVIKTLPPKIQTIVTMVKAELEDVKKTIGNDIEQINTEFASRIPGNTPELIDTNVSSKLAALWELFDSNSSKLDPKAVDAVTEFGNPMQLFPRLVSAKRQEMDPTYIRLLQERDERISALEREQKLNYDQCQKEIAQKRRQATREQQDQLNDLLKENLEYQKLLNEEKQKNEEVQQNPRNIALPKELELIRQKILSIAEKALSQTKIPNVEQHLKNDPICKYYFEFTETVNKIKKECEKAIKTLVDKDNEAEDQQTQDLLIKIRTEIKKEMEAGKKVDILKEATEVYYHQLVATINNALKDHPEFGRVVLLDQVIDHKLNQVPGSILLAEQMYVLSTGSKGTDVFTKAQATFSQQTNAIISTVYGSKENPDNASKMQSNASKMQRRAALLALPKTVQSDLLNLQIVNELRNKLDRPGQKTTSQALHKQAMDYLSGRTLKRSKTA